MFRSLYRGLLWEPTVESGRRGVADRRPGQKTLDPGVHGWPLVDEIAQANAVEHRDNGRVADVRERVVPDQPPPVLRLPEARLSALAPSASGRDSGPDQRRAARRPIRVIRHTSRWWKGRIRLKYTRPAQFL